MLLFAASGYGYCDSIDSYVILQICYSNFLVKEELFQKKIG